VERIASIRSCE